MANPVDFKVADELYRTAFGSVCTAVLADDSAQTLHAQGLVIKIYDPAGYDSAAGDSFYSAASTGATEFLKSAQVQQKAAAAGRNWAPIHASGKNAEGKSVYVTNYYPRSAQRLISGKVPLPAEAIHEIVHSIVSGLLELNQACGRAHGNIKPSNVLIGGRGAVAGEKIALTDPAARACAGPDDLAEDVRALGALIYHLVTHRAFPAASWPVADSEPWRRLGNRNRPWRDFCSSLLNPDARARPSLAEVAKAVQSLAVRKLINRTTKKIAAAVLVSAALLGGSAWMVLRWEDSVKSNVREAREQLQQKWLLVLDDPANEKLFASEPYSACLTKDRAVKDLIDTALAADGWTALYPSAIQNLVKARGAAHDCQQAWLEAFAADRLKPNASGQNASAQLEDARQKGWYLPSDPPDLATVPVLSENPTGDEIVKAARLLQLLRTRLSHNNPAPLWDPFLQKLEPLQKGPDFYIRIARYLQQEAAKSIKLSETAWVIDLTGLNDCSAMALGTAMMVPRNIDIERMKRDEAARKLDEPSDGNINWFRAYRDPKTGAWTSNADIYARATDPRVALADTLRAEFKTQIENPTKDNPDEWPAAAAANFPSFIHERDSLDSEIKNLVRPSYVRKDAEEDAQHPGAIDETGQAITSRMTAFVKSYRIPSDNVLPALIAQLKRIPLHNQAVLAIKEKQLGELEEELKSGKRYMKADGEVRRAQISALCATLPLLDDFPDAPPDLIEPYKTEANKRRERLWQALRGRLPTTLAGTSPLSVGDIKAASEGYEKWCVSVKALVDALSQFQPNKIIGMTAFIAFDAQWPSSADQERKSFWTTEAVAANGLFHAVAAPYLPRWDNLREIQKDDAATIAALASKPAPAAGLASVMEAESFLAAWGRLKQDGKFPGPASVEGLKMEVPVRTKLKAVKSVVDASKLLASSELSKDLQETLAAGPGRWCAVYSSAQTNFADLDATMSLHDAFDMDEKTLKEQASKLGPAGLYNAMLWLTETSVAQNAPSIASDAGDLKDAAAALLPPLKIDGERMTLWLSSHPSLPQLAAVLDRSVYCLAAQPPDLIGQALAASVKLREKQPKEALALSSWFHDNESAAIGPKEAAAWGKNFLDLANAFPAENDKPSKIAALTHAVQLGDTAAMVSLLQIAPKLAVDELTPVRGKLDATILLLLAKLYESGSVDKQVVPNLSSARESYALAAGKGSQEATKWLADHPNRELAPNHATATARPAGGIDLKWEWSHDPAAQFRVYRTTGRGDPVGELLTKTPIKPTTYSDDAPPTGSTCYYKIVVVFNGVEGGSAPASADPYPPAPAEPNATPAPTGGIKLTWKPVTDSTLKGYNVSRATAPSGTFTKLPDSPVASASYIDPAAPAGAVSYYRITTVDVLHEGSGADAHATPLPPAPQGLKVKAVDGTIELTWTPVSDPTLTNYYVYRGIPLEPPEKLPKAQNSYADAKAVSGKTYTYAIRAVDPIGEGPGAPASATVPPTPSGAVAAPDAGAGHITVTWTKLNDPSVKGYTVSRSTMPAGKPIPLTKAPIAIATFTDAQVLAGATYSYEIRAVTDIGEGKAATAKATVPPAAVSRVSRLLDAVATDPPPAPTHVQATPAANGQSITVTWDPVRDPTLKEYHVFRDPPAVPGVLWKQIVDGKLNSFNDNEVKAGITYSYDVHAVNASGQGPGNTYKVKTASASTGPKLPENGR